MVGSRGEIREFRQGFRGKYGRGNGRDMQIQSGVPQELGEVYGKGYANSVRESAENDSSFFCVVSGGSPREINLLSINQGPFGGMIADHLGDIPGPLGSNLGDVYGQFGEHLGPIRGQFGGTLGSKLGPPNM